MIFFLSRSNQTLNWLYSQSAISLTNHSKCHIISDYFIFSTLLTIQWLTYHHSSRIEKIETVRAFHFGTSFLVEVHVVLPETMLVREAHDIAEGLQQKIERLPEVERVSSLLLFIFMYLLHFVGIRSHRL